MAKTNLGRVVGLSAYEVAVKNGYIGSEAEWLASLKGETGEQGPQGPQGPVGSGSSATVQGETLVIGQEVGYGDYTD